MTQNFRHPEILELARQHGKVGVEALAAHFNVTVQTIRRDLSDLAEAGQLERVHGGAMLPSGVQNIGYDDRRDLNPTAKAQIARACAAAIPDGASLFLNIGTTTEAVAQALLRHRDLMVVTNNLNVANILARNPNCEVIVAGGSLRRSDGGLVGSLTMRMIEQFRTDIAVIGCSALDQSGNLLDFDVAEVGVSQTILSHARRRFVVADHSKWARSAPARIANLTDVDLFVSDQPPPDPVLTLCKQHATQVVLPDFA